MHLLLTILIVIAAVVLVLLVLVQNSKGGGLAAGLSSSNQIMGVSRTTDFLEKATWTLIAVIVVLTIASTGFDKNRKSLAQQTSALTEQAQEMQQPVAQDEVSAQPAETAPISAE